MSFCRLALLPFCRLALLRLSSPDRIPETMLELHVWGSAFGLPSFDPECLALITYLHNSLPVAEWRLVPSNDPSISPSSRTTSPPLYVNLVRLTTPRYSPRTPS